MADSDLSISCSVRTDCYGYRVWSIDGRIIREHRLVMEIALGRRLTPDEVVHHKDHNKLNNAFENLKLTTRAEHRREHSGFLSDTEKECSVCHIIKPLAAFYKRTKPQLGRTPYLPACVGCARQYYWDKIRPSRPPKGRAKKLTADAVREIRIAYANGGVSQKVLGQRFGVSQAMIHTITTGTYWRGV